MEFTTNPEIRLSSQTGVYSFSDYSTGKYHSIIKEAKIIAFDSGESSKRREYIASTLSYLTNIKGIPSVVLSALDSGVTKTFLNKTPQNIRKKILSLGIFHTYLNIVEKLREILEHLCISREYRQYMQLFFGAMRAIQTQLVKEISKLGILCILDRSIISNYLYTKVICENSQVNWNWAALYNLQDFKPYHCFFVHSNEKESVVTHGSMYDTQEGINHSIKIVIPKVKEAVPNLTQLQAHHSFEENMKLIRSKLDSL